MADPEAFMSLHDRLLAEVGPEVADLAEALGIQPLEEEPGEVVDDTRTIG